MMSKWSQQAGGLSTNIGKEQLLEVNLGILQPKSPISTFTSVFSRAFFFLLVEASKKEKEEAAVAKGGDVHHVCQGLNSHYFHIIGDKLINPIVGVYIPIIRIPIKGGMSLSPKKRDF